MLNNAGRPVLNLGLARIYGLMWEDGGYLKRRVETIRIIDRALSKRSVTLDIDQSKLLNLLRQNKNDSRPLDVGVAGGSSHYCLHIPLFFLPREPLYDISVTEGSGRNLHLSRGYINISVVAHIIAGCYIRLKGDECDASGVDRLFDDIVTYLGETSTHQQSEVRKCILNYFIDNKVGGGQFKVVKDFLDDLRNEFLLCVELPLQESGETQILKVSLLNKEEFDSSVNPLGEGKASTPSSSLGGALHSGTDSKTRFKSFIQKATQLVGLQASRLDLPMAILGKSRGGPTSHVRVLAPEGTIIDNCHLYDKARYKDDREVSYFDGMKLRFHHERAILFDYGLSSSNYFLTVKLNPKRSIFLIPAAIASFVVGILLFIFLLHGPFGKQDSAAAYAGALFIIPSGTALFISNSSEHEIVSQMLGFGRLFHSLSSVLSIIVGAMAVVSSDFGKCHFSTPIAFSLILIALISSFLSFMLFIFQIVRIGGVRRIVRRSSQELRAIESVKDVAQGVEKFLSIQKTCNKKIRRRRNLYILIFTAVCFILYCLSSVYGDRIATQWLC